MKINRESIVDHYDRHYDYLNIIATETAPEDEVSFIPVVTHCLGLYSFNGATDEELTQVANTMWNKVRVEVGNTKENFTTCVLRELRSLIFRYKRDKDLYDVLVCDEDFWRKWLMS